MGFGDVLAMGDAALKSALGGSVTYTPTVGIPVTVQGVFDEAALKLDLTQPGVSTSSPAVFLRLADLPSDPDTDLTATVTVNGTVFTPWDVQKDGQGGVFLRLHR